MRKLAAFLLFFLLFVSPAFAVSVSIDNYPSSVTSDSFNVDVSVLGASAGQNYLRAEIYKGGTTNYFGETYSGSDWYGGSSGTSYFPINIVDSKTTASATLQVRIGTPTSTEFPGAGSYKLKIKRYTSSGNAAGSDDESIVDLTVNYSAPTTPTPTPKPSSSSSSSSSSSTTSLVKSPTFSKVSAPTASQVSSVNSTNSLVSRQNTNNSDKIATDFAKVRNVPPTRAPNGRVAVLGTSKKEFPFVITLILGALFSVVSAGIVIFRNWDKVKIWLEN